MCPWLYQNNVKHQNISPGDDMDTLYLVCIKQVIRLFKQITEELFIF